MIYGKVWGTTEPLLITPMIEIHRININPRSFCSVHMHRYKYNLFYVISGTLQIHVNKNDYNLTDIITLGEGQFTTVAPNEYHKFVSEDTPVESLEVYYLTQINDDIVRKTVGGLADAGKKSTDDKRISVLRVR